MWPHSKKLATPKPDQALPGRNERMPVPAKHFVNGNPLVPPFPAGTELAMFGLGSPLKDLQVQNQDADATFVAALDGQALVRLLGLL